MSSLVRPRIILQATRAAVFLSFLGLILSAVSAAEPCVPKPVKKASVPVQTVSQADPEMKAYKEEISGTDVSFEMLPIPGGEFLMGSPDSDPEKKADEQPQHKVRVEPFWMGKHEVTWDEYDIWSFSLDIQRRKVTGGVANDKDKIADAVTRPTKPYTDMTFDMGHDGFPAICMTQIAAKMYCKWLSEKTGHYYRLPTEAEWEYACRAGTSTVYSFGNDPALLDEYAWHTGNSEEKYQKIGKKKPNPWGLHDMHGNVAEWVLDQYQADFYQQLAKNPVTNNPLSVPTKIYERVVRGGSWQDEANMLRSATRVYSEPDWKQQDPQIPQSIWYLTDALHVGFRVVRPLRTPTADEIKKLQIEPIPKDLVRE
ncbi:MAG: formylglycine-generating enzyme family protein [Planctomycetaceae bacterium]